MQVMSRNFQFEAVTCLRHANFFSLYDTIVIFILIKGVCMKVIGNLYALYSA